MSWIGRKRIAFIPVHRPNAHPPDDPVPADWPNEIRRRVFCDPDTTTRMDRSLRAYIHAASSGLADLDGVVQPMVVLDEQDVPVDALEGQFGAQLRSQGFDAGALVMLGQPPTGTSQRGGFWARFDMSEHLGVWAMECMHVLTNFNDLYPFNGNMGGFDEMACNCGTHPSAYTKAAVGWLDPSAIALHDVTARNYDLHAVGLVQPPAFGRWAAVRIGTQVPYLMIEARMMVDQFESKSQFEPGIPSQGVIVYRIQTTDPNGTAQNATAPVALLTATALTVGQGFTSDTGIRVQVRAAISGGFSITIDEPGRATVPDVFEMSGANAAKAVHAAGLVAKFTGANQANAWVASQSPTAGQVVALGSTVTMLLRTGPMP